MGSHLDHVAADDIEPGTAAHQLHGLARAQTADLRRSGAGRKGRIEAVDVERNVGGAVAHDLADFADRLMNELSGGERQRVVLARAIATDAKIFLLDEPTANLDLAHQALMFRLIRERCKNENCSAVVISHDLNLAAEFADKILMLNDGSIFACGAPTEVLNQQNIDEVYNVQVLLDQNPASGKVRVTTVY